MALWSDPAVKSAMSELISLNSGYLPFDQNLALIHRVFFSVAMQNRFQLNNSAQYFFEQLERIFQDGWVPNDDGMLLGHSFSKSTYSCYCTLQILSELVSEQQV